MASPRPPLAKAPNAAAVVGMMLTPRQPAEPGGRFGGAASRYIDRAFAKEEEAAGYVQPLAAWVNSLAAGAPPPTLEASSAMRTLPRRSAKKVDREVTVRTDVGFGGLSRMVRKDEKRRASPVRSALLQAGPTGSLGGQ
jgi:hypothetical protein